MCWIYNIKESQAVSENEINSVELNQITPSMENSVILMVLKSLVFEVNQKWIRYS